MSLRLAFVLLTCLILGPLGRAPAAAVSCAELNCDDENPCTDDGCDEMIGCTHTLREFQSCDDGLACTSGDICLDGQCRGFTDCPDDGNPCTTETCGLLGCESSLNTDSCDDGDPCTQNDVCADGVCTAGSARNCNDGNPCTLDTCNSADGSCEYAPASGACSDGDSCTVGDQCVDGVCQGGAAPSCDDANPCTTDSCQPGLGCRHIPDDANTCSDASACTTGDHCSSGVCVGSAITCPDDDNVCTTPFCHPVTGCGYLNNTVSCDDANPCTLNDGCGGGVCAGATPKNCDDANPCTTDTCDINTGACGHADNTAPCDDGDACTTGDACAGGVCVGGAGISCDDGNPCTTDACGIAGCTHTPDDAATCSDGSACTTGDHCSSGACVGSAVSCPDDGNPCTTPSCNPSTGCGFVANTASCEDGNPCTLNDVCAAGTCTAGTPKSCNDANGCTDDACNPENGQCVFSPNTASCNDGDACTTGDVCSGGTCHGGSTVSCDDGNPCTTDACSGGGCTHTPDDAAICSDGSACTTADHCSSGACVGSAVTCPDDDSPCTTPSCSPSTGCGFVANTASCDDGNPCTLNDVCAAGACTAGTAKDCSDANVCTDDACNPQDGQCAHTPNTASCNDGDACTTGDTCAGGTCHGGSGAGCDDGNPCTTDACDGVGGCTHTPDDAGVCSDGSVCTTNDHCSGGACVGDAVNCPDDDNPCTSPSCNPSTGCGSVLNTASCDDGNPCTVNDVCAAGTCTAGLAKVCSDGNPCTDDLCNAGDGACTHTPNTAACSDGDACTTDDHCADGVCQSGPPLSCADDDPCTTNEVCVTGIGCQHTNVIGSCDDGDVCTTDDQCRSGLCTGTRTVCPDDDNPCTFPVCNAQSGCGFVDATGPCDDGDPATADDACVAGVCVGTRTNTCSATPATGCASAKPRGATITLKDASDAKKDNIAWRWTGGAALPRNFLGMPATTTNLRVCVYAQSAGVPSLILTAPFPAGGRCGKKACWSESKKSVAYRGNDASGNLKLQFKSGDKPTIALSGSGARLAMPALPPAADPAVVVQLQRADDASCVTSTHPGPGDGKAGSFKAKSE